MSLDITNYKENEFGLFLPLNAFKNPEEINKNIKKNPVYLKKKPRRNYLILYLYKIRNKCHNGKPKTFLMGIIAIL